MMLDILCIFLGPWALFVVALYAYELIARYRIRRCLRKPNYNLKRLLHEAQQQENAKAEAVP